MAVLSDFQDIQTLAGPYDLQAKVINFSNNQISGKLDYVMLDSIESIDISGNTFEGGIRVQFNAASKLEYLDASNCGIHNGLLSGDSSRRLLQETNPLYMGLPDNGIPQEIHLENNYIFEIPSVWNGWNALLPKNTKVDIHLEGNPITGKCGTDCKHKRPRSRKSYNGLLHHMMRHPTL